MLVEKSEEPKMLSDISPEALAKESHENFDK